MSAEEHPTDEAAAVDDRASSSVIPSPARVIAFHLPQFHPTTENDEWWGKGFTEWTNVTKARPRFRGHYQPHLPADLGFYDLRLQEAREAQSDLAARYGIDGFLYYHYWFEGRRILEQPLDRMLATGEPGIPFALCWANETWSRRWDGSESQVLLKQTYSHEDDLAHIRHLAQVFASPRYIRVDGKPLFVVYRVHELPDARRTVETWRQEAERLGIGEIFLALTESFAPANPTDFGFDAAIEFQPTSRFLTERVARPLAERVLNKFRPADHPAKQLELRSYAALARAASGQGLDDYLRFAGVTPAWDNSARRREWPRILVGSTPELYEEWLASALRRPLRGAPEKLVFVNAWNEWAEGNHLEPDVQHGHAYLEATRRAVDAYQALVDAGLGRSEKGS